MEKSFITIAIIVAFLAGFGSGIWAELQASDNWVIDLSSIESSSIFTSLFNDFPDSSVVIYTSAQYMGASNKSDVDTCPVPLAVLNNTGYTFTSLYKPITGCNVNLLLLLLLRAEVPNRVSEARQSGSIIVPNIRANKADVQVLRHKQKAGLVTAVNLRLITKNIMSDNNHNCSQADLHLIMIVHRPPFEEQQHQPSFLHELLTWVAWLIMLLLINLILKSFFMVMDYVERPYLYGGPGIDPAEDEGIDLPDPAAWNWELIAISSGSLFFVCIVYGIASYNSHPM